MTGEVRFASPWWFLALLLVALLVWWRGRRGRAPALGFSSTALLEGAARAVRSQPGYWLAGLRIGGLVLVVLALARPQVEKSETREDTRGINLVLALDFSGTMRTRDFFLDGRRVTRTQGMKEISAEFIRSRPNDRVGLVSFDRDASLISPLTLDHEWLLERLKHETNGVGTAIGAALVVAAGHLQQHTNETRVLVLMTDAENITGLAGARRGGGSAPTSGRADALHSNPQPGPGGAPKRPKRTPHARGGSDGRQVLSRP